MSVHDDRKQRRNTLETRLNDLSDRRERAFRETSFARSRQHAGVIPHDTAKLTELAHDESASDSLMTDIRRQLASIDAEDDHDSPGRLAEKGRRLLSRLRP